MSVPHLSLFPSLPLSTFILWAPTSIQNLTTDYTAAAPAATAAATAPPSATALATPPAPPSAPVAAAAFARCSASRNCCNSSLVFFALSCDLISFDWLL